MASGFDKEKLPLEVYQTDAGWVAEAILWGAGGLEWIGRGATPEEAVRIALSQMEEWLAAAALASQAVREAASDY